MQNSVVGGSSILTTKMMVGEDRIMIKRRKLRIGRRRGRKWIYYMMPTRLKEHILAN